MSEMSKGDLIAKALENAKSTGGQTYALLALRRELHEFKEVVGKWVDEVKSFRHEMNEFRNQQIDKSTIGR